ncbi:MAG TPA: cbb3-type cytochrome c oxidase subunit II, partial [Arenimonas sp.]|nr:cbb3-type cytochrome c oxidase subunit II [Arenimonas sp.]
SDDWHRVHLMNPRDVVPVSNMPGYPFLAEQAVDPAAVARNMRALQTLGDPYTNEEIEGAAAAVAGKSELDALIAYLQALGKNAPKG